MRAAAVCSLAVLAAGAAHAQEAPTEVSRAQVAGYRAGIEAGCRSAGARRGEARAKVDGFCSCMMDTLDRNLSAFEWQLAAFYSLKKRLGEERLVLDPHLSELSACRPGA